MPIRPEIVTIALATALSVSTAKATEVLAGPIDARVLDVIDGDTITVSARIWLGQAIEIRVRLAGIDTPELRGKCAAEQALAQKAREALASRIGGRTISLHDVRYGTYAGRVIARLSDGEAPDIGQSLLSAGLARAYGGRGPRPDWCAD